MSTWAALITLRKLTLTLSHKLRRCALTWSISRRLGTWSPSPLRITRVSARAASYLAVQTRTGSKTSISRPHLATTFAATAPSTMLCATRSLAAMTNETTSQTFRDSRQAAAAATALKMWRSPSSSSLISKYRAPTSTVRRRRRASASIAEQRLPSTAQRWCAARISWRWSI